MFVIFDTIYNYIIGYRYQQNIVLISIIGLSPSPILYNAYVHSYSTSRWLYYRYAVSYLDSCRKGVHEVMFAFPPQCYAFMLLPAVYMLCLESQDASR